MSRLRNSLSCPLSLLYLFSTFARRQHGRIRYKLYNMWKMWNMWNMWNMWCLLWPTDDNVCLIYFVVSGKNFTYGFTSKQNEAHIYVGTVQHCLGAITIDIQFVSLWEASPPWTIESFQLLDGYLVIPNSVCRSRDQRFWREELVGLHHTIIRRGVAIILTA